MNVIIKSLNNDANIIKKVKKFLFAQIKQEFGYDYVPKWHQDIVNLDEYYINPQRNNFFIALDEKTNEIIATIGIRAYDKDFKEFRGIYSKDSTSSIWRLFVDKRYRRCGLASKMFNVAENFAYESSYDNIYLHTHKNLNGALDFWTKMGFIITLDVDDELETVHMEKKILGIKLPSSPSIFNYAVEF
ncbi:GNAT family N-acetyltransferase [Methanobrevibacter sp.]|uniref:GNAT family N-acetyltransferase n=1 Tax=Methanobrevibacter sp. TaxID=66852 RepID=UPI00388E7D88